MAKAQPFCDRHRHLQMVPFSFEYPTGKITGHVCPLSGCNRHHDEKGYFDLLEGKPVRETEPTMGSGESTRAAIMRAIFTRTK